MIPVSICVIMKNEEKHMENFLSAIKKHMGNYPYELVLVDTGSTDRTIEISKKYTDKIFHFDWIGDFSAARNYSISCAKNDWILVLDCDEYIVDFNPAALDWMATNYPKCVGAITRRDHYEINETDTVSSDLVERFFNRKLYHYEAIIHEQVCSFDGQQNYERVDISLTAEHYGYAGSAEELLAKANRNNELLFQMLKEDPTNPYVLFQIGQSYSLIRDYEKACQYFGEGLKYVSDSTLSYVNDMVLGYGNALLRQELYEEALILENIYEDFCHTADFLCLMGTIYLRNNMLLKAMQEYLKATACDIVQEEGSNSYIPLYNMGIINEMLGDTASAIKLYEKCGQFPLALERLSELQAN